MLQRKSAIKSETKKILLKKIRTEFGAQNAKKSSETQAKLPGSLKKECF